MVSAILIISAPAFTAATDALTTLSKFDRTVSSGVNLIFNLGFFCLAYFIVLVILLIALSIFVLNTSFNR